MRKFQQDLEKHFVVVNWDQRGAGLSYSKGIPKDSMTINQFVADTLELSHYLCKYFEQDKIYLLGHSWGTMIGLLAIYKEPSLFMRYFGVAQVVNYLSAEKLSYKKILEKAISTNNQKAIKALESIGEPPWNNLKHDQVHQQYVDSFGGGISHDNKLINKILLALLFSREYTLLDMIRHIKGQHFSLTSLQNEMRNLDLNKIDSVDVPIYFCMGRHDLIVPPQLTYAFYRRLQAKDKHWIWFEKSAHSPMFEEREKFLGIIISETDKDN